MDSLAFMIMSLRAFSSRRGSFREVKRGVICFTLFAKNWNKYNFIIKEREGERGFDFVKVERGRVGRRRQGDEVLEDTQARRSFDLSSLSKHEVRTKIERQQYIIALLDVGTG